jgi:hypothetical protein
MSLINFLVESDHLEFKDVDGSDDKAQKEPNEEVS